MISRPSSRSRDHYDLVENSWAVSRSPREAAWLLEFSREELDEPYSRMSDLLLQTAYDEIKDTIVASEKSPPYLIHFIVGDPDMGEALVFQRTAPDNEATLR